MCDECWVHETGDESEEIDSLRRELDAVKAQLAAANRTYNSLWKLHEERGEKIFDLQRRNAELCEELEAAKAKWEYAELKREDNWRLAERFREELEGAEGDSVARTGEGDTWTSVALSSLGDTLGAKRSDYSVDSEFGNFEAAAEAASIRAEEVMLAQVGIKMGRIKNLRDMDDTPHYEPLLDSYKDLAGYAILAYAHALKWAEGGGDETGIYRKSL